MFNGVPTVTIQMSEQSHMHILIFPLLTEKKPNNPRDLKKIKTTKINPMLTDERL